MISLVRGLPFSQVQSASENGSIFAGAAASVVAFAEVADSAVVATGAAGAAGAAATGATGTVAFALVAGVARPLRRFGVLQLRFQFVNAFPHRIQFFGDCGRYLLVSAAGLLVRRVAVALREARELPQRKNQNRQKRSWSCT